MGKVQYSFYRPLLSGYQDVHIHVQWLYDGWKLGCPMTQNSLSLYLGFRSNVVARFFYEQSTKKGGGCVLGVPLRKKEF